MTVSGNDRVEARRSSEMFDAPPPGIAPTRACLTANGLTMSYLEWIGPESPRVAPVVILHSALQQGEGMSTLASHLAHNGRVIVPDLRGRGQTDRPTDGYDPATMADDVAALVDAIGLDHPVVVGRLHGGLVAYHLASRHPDAIRGLVIGGTMPDVDAARSARMVDGVRALPRRFATLDDAIAFYQVQLGLPEERVRHDIPHDLVRNNGEYTWFHNLEIVEEIERRSTPRDDWDLLRTIRCPVLVLRGQGGSITDRSAARFRETLRGCSIHTVFGAGHDVFLGAGQEQTFGAIDMFLIRLSDRAASAHRASQGLP